MQSLAEECTPLKKRYDACFNLWFEGYLQPALDAAAQAERGAFPVVSDGSEGESSGSGSSSSSSAGAGPSSSSTATSSAGSGAAKPAKKPLITSWASSPVFRTYRHRDDAPLPAADDMVSAAHVHDDAELEPLDTLGMSRHEIKAAQYERRCGKVWREYQSCLKTAIAGNQNLSGLLKQAQDDHPLLSQEGLQGGPWDPNHQPDK